DVVHCHGWFTAMVPAYLKTVYQDDPTFKDSKVFFSLYNEEFGNDSLGSKYAEMAAQSDIDASKLKDYESGSYVDIYNGALSFTDVVVKAQADINLLILSYKIENNIGTIDASSDEHYEIFSELYDEFENEEVSADAKNK